MDLSCLKIQKYEKYREKLKALIFQQKIKLWKKLAGPYSHEINSLGYRSDCSGFISYMWDLDSKLAGGGPRTWGSGPNNLRYWGLTISRQMLKRGDIILVPNRHVVLFDRWAKNNNNQYYGYEVCHIPGCRGYQHHKLNYPYNLTLRPYFSQAILLRHLNEY